MSTRRHVAAGVAAAGLALLVTGTMAGATSPCLRVKGNYEEQATSMNCASPVGLCIVVDYSGSVTGQAFGSATAIATTADTEATGVLSFTADSTLDANVRGRTGQLTIKNAGVFRTTGTGDIVDLQVITGGTGDLAGASGAIRASGVFVNGVGSSRYEGEICLPQ